MDTPYSDVLPIEINIKTNIKFISFSFTKLWVRAITTNL